MSSYHSNNFDYELHPAATTIYPFEHYQVFHDYQSQNQGSFTHHFINLVECGEGKG